MAAAVGLQDHFWELSYIVLVNQGKRGAGETTDAFLRRLAASLPGVDVDRAMAAMGTPAVVEQLQAAREEAQRFRIRGTPATLIGKSGEAPRLVTGSPHDPQPFTAVIDGLLDQK